MMPFIRKNHFLLTLPTCLFCSFFYNSLFGENIIFLSFSLIPIIFSCLIYISTSDSIEFKLNHLLGLIVLFIFWMWLSRYWSIASHTSALTFVSISAFAIIFLATFFVSKNIDTKKLYLSALLPVLVIIGYGLFQLLNMGITPHSFFHNPNSHAALINITAFPLITFLLYYYTKHSLSIKSFVLAIAIFILFFFIAISQSRGVILAFSIAFVFLLLSTKNICSKNARLVVILVVALAFIFANFATDTGVTQRMETLVNPTSAGSDRFIIWQAGLEMVKQHPIIGTGIGTFWLTYPQFRYASDDSGGFHAHNDLLQLAIETGLVGCLLYMLIAVLLTAIIWRLLRNKNINIRHQYELCGLFAGLVTVFIHGLFTFNFYFLPVMIMAGFYLGRIQLIDQHYYPEKTYRVDIKSYRNPLTLRFLLALLLFVFIINIFLYGLGHWYKEQGALAAKDNQLEDAEALLNLSIRLIPDSDAPKYVLADLYRQALTIKGVSAEEKKFFYLQSLDLLQQAQKLNPVRPEIYLLLGKLYKENRTYDVDWHEKALGNFKQALHYNPRFHPARTQLALLLQKTNPLEAREVLESGLVYNYPATANLPEYYGLITHILLNAGEIEAGMEMAKKVDTILVTLGRNENFTLQMKSTYKLK